MIPKSLQAYSTMQMLWEEGVDLIEVYSRMSLGALRQILQGNGNTVNSEGLQEYFREEYGISNLTLGACNKILKRLKQNGVLKTHDHEFCIIRDEVEVYSSSVNAYDAFGNDFHTVFGSLKKDIHDSAFETIGEDYSDVEIEKILMDFFSSFGGELAINGTLDNPKAGSSRKTTRTQKLRHFLSKKIIEEQQSNSSFYKTISNLSQGSLIADFMSMEDFASFGNSLKGLTVYLDSPIVFALIGLSDEWQRKLAKEVIVKLQEYKAQVKVTSVHYDEVKNSIAYAIPFLNTDYPDRTRINYIFTIAEERGLTADNLQLILQQLPAILQKENITVQTAPTKVSGQKIVFGDDFRDKLETLYKEGRQSKTLPAHRINSIKRDGKALEMIVQERGLITAASLKEAKAILVCNNLAVGKTANTMYTEKCETVIPVVVTAETLSTILWGNNPTPNSSLNKLKLICDCKNVIRVRTSSIRAFYRTANQLYSEKKITNEEYLHLQTSKLIPKYLEEEAYNYPNLYSNEVAKRISERIEADLRESLCEQEEQLKIIEQNSLTKRLKLQVKYLGFSNVLTLAIGIGLLALSLWLKYRKPEVENPEADNPTVEIIAMSISMLFTGWAALSWTGIIPTRAKLGKMIAKFLYRTLTQEAWIGK